MHFHRQSLQEGIVCTQELVAPGWEQEGSALLLGPVYLLPCPRFPAPPPPPRTERPVVLGKE